jgi:MFS family permease
MSFYLIAAFGGPVIGPISGSFLAAATTYKWIFWLLTIFAGLSFVAGASLPRDPIQYMRLQTFTSSRCSCTGDLRTRSITPLSGEIHQDDRARTSISPSSCCRRLRRRYSTHFFDPTVSTALPGTHRNFLLDILGIHM